MVLDKLPGYCMTIEELIEIVRRSCERHGATLVGLNCNLSILSLVLLIKGDSRAQGGISLDVDSVLCGFADPITFEFLDNELSPEVSGPCPNTTVVINETNYKVIAESNGGLVYEF